VIDFICSGSLGKGEVLSLIPSGSNSSFGRRSRGSANNDIPYLTQSQRVRRRRYASGVGLWAGGSTPNELAVRHVIEKLPVVATSATRLSSPMIFSAAA